MENIVAASYYLVSFVKTDGTKNVGVVCIAGSLDGLSFEETENRILEATKEKYPNVARIEHGENITDGI